MSNKVMEALIVDIDGTICPIKEKGEDYADLVPDEKMVERLRQAQSEGFRIVLFTSRNMRTYEGRVGEITKNTVPVLLDWLKRWNVPYDELLVGKPWPGHTGYYVDDRAVRPSEFLNLSHEELTQLIEDDRKKR